MTERKGVHAVSAAFLDFDWGPIENGPHDLGTDLFVFVRDERLEDTGLVLGAQVKTGASRFSMPRRGPGRTIGWWYAERHKRHFDYWTSHVIPHILVLHDEQTHRSYWVHVTRDDVVDTGKGAKILVPSANTIDGSHRDSLMRVASSARRPVPFEGTAWTGGAPSRARDDLRYAILVPRLVAPHPDAFVEQLTPPQAIAMLMQARLNELSHYAERLQDVPVVHAAGDSASWSWRFFAALAQRVTKDDVEALRTPLEDAPDPAARAAAAATFSSGLIQDGRPGDALAILADALKTDGLSAVDDAWLRVQRARALVDLGEVQDAHREARAVQAIRLQAPDDVTATALQGIAAGVLFGTGAWGELKLEVVIEGADRVANWWRTETMARGTRAMTERVFKEWARDTARTIGASDEANNQLYVAALSAGHIGDHGAWRQLSSLLGRDTLVRLKRASDPQRAVDGIQTLRRAGDVEALKLAVRRLANDGPAIAVRSAGESVHLQRSTRTTLTADLEFVAVGGDLVDLATAHRAVDWIAERLDKPKSFLELQPRGGPKSVAPLIECLAGVVKSVPERGLALAQRHLAASLRDDEFVAWSKVLLEVPDGFWSEETVEPIWQLQIVQSSRLRWPFLGLRSAYDAGARETLLAATRDGSHDALAYLKQRTPLDALDRDVVHAVLPDLLRRLENIRAKAREGRASLGSADPGEDLALILGHHPDSVPMNALLDFLDDPRVARRSKGGALVALGHHVDSLTSVRARLLKIAERVSKTVSPLDDPIFDPDIAGHAGYLAGRLDPASAPARVTELARGPVRQRKWAAYLAASSPSTSAALLAFAADDHPVVRAAAASAAIDVLDDDPENRLAEAVVRNAAEDPGRLPALAVAATALTDVHEVLLSHVSAEVRSGAAAPND